jgi:MYXO-CTERM domain-containing protein
VTVFLFPLAATLLTVSTLSPLLFPGAGPWQIVIVVACSTTGGTALGLLFAPVVFALLERRRRE